ncbi:probable protein phosphatase 2C T23F11.1 [Watersipora subatra]|uniref:probable protein phosphatase 2C T23F11.1 n=1 Tax=Watersipora subatra TaxID=2589382 RepID=UPI00355C9611
MGQTLSEPITTKQTTASSNRYLKVVISCMQGWRVTMEDAHTHFLSLPGDPSAAFFAVFDGHGGTAIAQYASQNLHKKVVQQLNYSRGDYESALKNGYLQLDREMQSDIHLRDDMSGTTAVSILIKNNKLFCANAGDSRAIASVDGTVQQLSFDHKPNNEMESKRIIAAGGWVEYNRVNGNLALSRALGDFIFKKNTSKPPEEQIVSAAPDIVTKDITASHEFIIMACDGIWDVLSNLEVLQFVRTRIAQRTEPSVICEELLNTCLAPDAQMGGLGCDNMTVLLICILNGGSYESLATRCARPAKSQTIATGSSISPGHLSGAPNMSLRNPSVDNQSRVNTRFPNDGIRGHSPTRTYPGGYR